jgi:hypothetical protein
VKNFLGLQAGALAIGTLSGLGFDQPDVGFAFCMVAASVWIFAHWLLWDSKA